MKETIIVEKENLEKEAASKTIELFGKTQNRNDSRKILGENNNDSVDSKAKIQVFIRNLSGRTRTVDICCDDSILEVKEKLEKLEKVPKVRCGLRNGGCILRDENSVDLYNIKKESTLEMYLRPSFNIFLHVKYFKKTIPLRVKSTFIVDNILKLIQKVHRISCERRRLMYWGKQLELSLPLTHYKILSGSEIELIELSSSSFILFIQYRKEEPIAFDVEPRSLIRYLKFRICTIKKIPANEQELIFDRKPLMDSSLLGELKIPERSILSLEKCKPRLFN